MADGVPFGPYLIQKRLAAGGMAEVFLARRAADPGRPLALKRLLPLFSKDPERAAMFLAEARVAAQVNHPYLVRVNEVGQADGQLYLAMEYVHGVPLTQVLAARAGLGEPGLPWPMATRICCWLLEALQYAHALRGLDGQPLGLVHRDVNPANVMLSFAGEPKLIDFGIAKAKPAWHKTDPGVVKAKLEYAAPEQYRREPLDARVDVYGAALTLYELLCGANPFLRDGPVETVEAVLHAAPPPLTAPGLPPRLREVIHAALDKEPSRRPQSAQALRRALELALVDAKAPVGVEDVRALLDALFPASSRPAPAAERPAAPATRPLSGADASSAVTVLDGLASQVTVPVLAPPTEPSLGGGAGRRYRWRWWWWGGALAALALGVTARLACG